MSTINQALTGRVFMLLIGSGSLVSCTGMIGDPSDNGGAGGAGGGRSGTGGQPETPTVDATGLPGPALAAKSRMRRLTVDEYNRTLLWLMGDTASANQVFASEARSPFDNDADKQDISQVTGIELLAGDAATRLMADKARRDRVVGCAPKPGDVMGTDCLMQFITTFGRRAWRRTLTGAEIQLLMGLGALAAEDKDFYSAVDGVIRSVLEDPEFFLRIEVGAPVPGAPGLFKLTGPEMATRLSYFLWGNAPDDQLLALAEAGGLDGSEQVRREAGRMLARPAGIARIGRFHALWMGYERFPTSPLARAMKDETDHLISRVIFENDLPWQELLRSPQTYVTYELAQHYGISIPATLKKGTNTAAWIPYAGTKRQGLLSHATFLQLGVQSGDTHPVLRGQGIRKLLFCQEIKKPTNINTSKASMTPTSPCKPEFLGAHRSATVCAGCHAQLDAVGFGLERYDAQGASRTSEYRRFIDVNKTGTEPVQAGTAGAVMCKIDGQGDFDGQPFSGPAELANLMLARPTELNACAAKQLYRFAMGLTDIDDVDQQFLDLMAKRMGAADFRLDELLLDFVSSGAFAHVRKQD